ETIASCRPIYYNTACFFDVVAISRDKEKKTNYNGKKYDVIIMEFVSTGKKIELGNFFCTPEIIDIKFIKDPLNPIQVNAEITTKDNAYPLAIPDTTSFIKRTRSATVSNSSVQSPGAGTQTVLQEDMVYTLTIDSNTPDGPQTLEININEMNCVAGFVFNEGADYFGNNFKLKIEGSLCFNGELTPPGQYSSSSSIYDTSTKSNTSTPTINIVIIYDTSGSMLQSDPSTYCEEYGSDCCARKLAIFTILELLQNLRLGSKLNVKVLAFDWVVWDVSDNRFFDSNHLTNIEDPYTAREDTLVYHLLHGQERGDILFNKLSDEDKEILKYVYQLKIEDATNYTAPGDNLFDFEEDAITINKYNELIETLQPGRICIEYAGAPTNFASPLRLAINELSALNSNNDSNNTYSNNTNSTPTLNYVFFFSDGVYNIGGYPDLEPYTPAPKNPIYTCYLSSTNEVNDVLDTISTTTGGTYLNSQQEIDPTVNTKATTITTIQKTSFTTIVKSIIKSIIDEITPFITTFTIETKVKENDVPLSHSVFYKNLRANYNKKTISDLEFDPKKPANSYCIDNFFTYDYLYYKQQELYNLTNLKITVKTSQGFEKIIEYNKIVFINDGRKYSLDKILTTGNNGGINSKKYEWVPVQ
ncbi:MAG: hypothetical protein V1872_08615, partial [bacterium]